MPGPIPMVMGPNGPMPMPSPEQIAAMQRQLAMDAEKAGMTVPQFIGELRHRSLGIKTPANSRQSISGSKLPSRCKHACSRCSNSSSSSKEGDPKLFLRAVLRVNLSPNISTHTAILIPILTLTRILISTKLCVASRSVLCRARPTRLPSRWLSSCAARI